MTTASQRWEGDAINRIMLREAILLLVLVSSSTIEGADLPSAIEVRARVLGTSYCAADNEVGFVNVGVSLTFRNSSTFPVLFFKSAGVISQITVFKTLQDLHEGRQEHQYSSTTIDAELAAPKTSMFVQIKPGETFSVKTKVALPIVLSENPTMTFGVRPGEHWLSLMVSTWPHQSVSPGAVQSILREERPIFFSSLMAPPVRIEIARVLQPKPCDSK